MRKDRHLIIWSIIAAGISSIAVQILTIREFLTQFYGNEITISLVLFSWLLLTGIGSLLSKPIQRGSVNFFGFLTFVLAVWPLIQLIYIRDFREMIFIHGSSTGFYQIFLYILLTTAPYCLLLGFILPFSLTVMRSNDMDFTSGDLYITDSIGDIIGGALFSFILVYWLKPFKIIAISSSLLILVSLLLLSKRRTFLYFFIPAILVGLFYFYGLTDQYELSTLSKQYGHIADYMESPFGRIVITREGPQHTFWESGVPLYSEHNVIESEEKIHYPLSQLDKVGRVLLISGGFGESIDEVEKYHPQAVDYVELDPYLTKAAQKLGIIRRKPWLNIINMDGRQYIKQCDQRYDAIIVDLPEPDTFQINRFFTVEFFGQAKACLNQGGIFSFSLNYSPNYIGEAGREKLSAIFNTAKVHFKNILLLPGEKAYFLCRDGKLNQEVPLLLERKHIQANYIQGNYSGNITEERIKDLRDIIDEHEFINTDFEPRVMNLIFQEWFQKHGTSPKLFVWLILGLAAVYLFLIRREEYLLFSTGLATMGVEMLIIFTFQVIYGYIYLKIGAIITAFLLGLLPGAIAGKLLMDSNGRSLIFSELLFLFLLILFYIWVSFFKGEPNQYLFLAYGFVYSFFCGFQFPQATEMIGEKNSPVAGCLAADLTGAALGVLLIGGLIIPLWGIQTAVILLVLIKISSGMIMLLKRPSEVNL